MLLVTSSPLALVPAAAIGGSLYLAGGALGDQVLLLSALWNCLSLSDKFTIKRRGAVGSLAVIHIHAITRSGNLRSVHP